MTRDMNLIRNIFVAIQSRKDARFENLEITGVDNDVLSRHLEMLLSAGLIEGTISGAYNDASPKILVKDLSWEGHDLASALANDGVWSKIKELYTPSQLATLPLKVISEVAKGLLTRWALSAAGL